MYPDIVITIIYYNEIMYKKRKNNDINKSRSFFLLLDAEDESFEL